MKTLEKVIKLSLILFVSISFCLACADSSLEKESSIARDTKSLIDSEDLPFVREFISPDSAWLVDFNETLDIGYITINNTYTYNIISENPSFIIMTRSMNLYHTSGMAHWDPTIITYGRTTRAFRTPTIVLIGLRDVKGNIWASNMEDFLNANQEYADEFNSLFYILWNNARPLVFTDGEFKPQTYEEGIIVQIPKSRDWHEFVKGMALVSFPFHAEITATPESSDRPILARVAVALARGYGYADTTYNHYYDVLKHTPGVEFLSRDIDN